MTRTRVLLGAALAAFLVFVPAASATTTASVNGAELIVTGIGGTDVITVSLTPADLLIPDPATPYVVEDPAGVNGGVATTGCTPDATTPTTKAICSRGAPAPAWGLFTVTINGGPGGDNIRSIAPLIVSGEGNTGDLTFINGEAGADTLVGSENNDVISGGADGDLIEGDAGNDIVTGGTVARTGDVPTGVDYDKGTVSPVSTTAGNDRVFGGAGSDIVTDGDSDVGSPSPDILAGFTCTLTGVVGGGSCPPTSAVNVDVPENDIDELFWGSRTKAITVNTTNPTPQGGCPTTAACTAAATTEGEIIVGMRGVWAGAGNDTLTGHSGTADVGNLFYGGAGNDRLEGLDGGDELLGGRGQDVLLGGVGGDFLNPGGIITSAAGAPTVMTTDGADTVDGGANGADATSGAVIVDSITYSGRTDNLTLNLKVTSGWGAAGENDTVVGVENVTGGHGADTITAGALASAIESDPIEPELPHPGEPVLGPPPPNGYYSNDVVHVRNGAADSVDCGGTAADPDSDTVTADRTPADVINVNCEIVDLPPAPPAPVTPVTPVRPVTPVTPVTPGAKQPDGTTTHTDPTTTVKISGGAFKSAGTVKVKKDGSFTLSKFVITCPSGTPSCSVKTTVASKYGTKSYSLKGGTKGAAKGKLSKKGMKQLKKRKSIKTTVTIRVVHRGKATTRKVKVTFKR